MNATLQRTARRLESRDKARAKRTAERLAYVDAVATRYEAAYLAANGQRIELRYTAGRLRSDKLKGSMTAEQAERRAVELEARAASITNPDEESC